jgi:type IV pilus assembly protein PilA
MFQSVLRRLRDAQATELEGGAAAEAGFTLIELMVVLLIIAILLAIAIPTFLGVTGSANDRAAQSNLTNALTEASAAYQSNNQTFQPAATMSGSAPEFSWLSGTSGGPTAVGGTNQISEYPADLTTVGDAQAVILAAYSKSGTCWYVAQLSVSPTLNGATAFDKAASGTGFQTGATTGGTYYAKQTTSNAAADCYAAYPEFRSGGFSWGSSYSSAAANT